MTRTCSITLPPRSRKAAAALRPPGLSVKLSRMSGGTSGVLAYFRTLRDERRQFGWKGLLRRRGWKFVAVVVAYYLVRDTILYILIPLAIAAGVLQR